MLNELGTIRLKDLEIFEEVARAHSIREVARRLNSTSGQISKTIQSLERTVGTKLFRRSVTGVLLTSQGSEFQIIVQELLASGEKMARLASGEGKTKLARTIAIAGTSFLNTHFTTPITCRAAGQWPTTVFRFLDLAPDQIVPVGLRGAFDAAVHFGPLGWPSTWSTASLGKSCWTLTARAGHPLPKRPTLKQILQFSFVAPTYWTAEGLVRGNDQFPLASSKRRMGFETATADAVVPILLESEQVAFLPDLLVRPLIESGQLREIRSGEISLVEKELFLSVKSDVVPAMIFEGLCAKMSESLNRK